MVLFSIAASDAYKGVCVLVRVCARVLSSGYLSLLVSMCVCYCVFVC